eukprot:5985266-Lingulodinium_polyedra.AAC.1
MRRGAGRGSRRADLPDAPWRPLPNGRKLRGVMAALGGAGVSRGIEAPRRSLSAQLPGAAGRVGQGA